MRVRTVFGGIWFVIRKAGGCGWYHNRYFSGKPPFTPCDFSSSSLYRNHIFVFMFYQKMYFPILSEEKNAELLLEDFSQQYGLSPREKEVFSLIKEGRSNSEIAGDLYISENTVKFHMKNILRKTECSNRTELITLFKG